MDHARARAQSALRDRGPVEDDRFEAAWSRRYARDEGPVAGDADLQRRHAVVEGQVQEILATDFRQPARQDGRIAPVRARLTDRQPSPMTIIRLCVEIESADPGGGHVRHGQLARDERPTRLNGLCIGHEADTETGGVTAQVPDGWANEALGLRGQAIEERLGLWPSLALDVQFAGIVPTDRRLGSGLFLVISPKSQGKAR